MPVNRTDMPTNQLFCQILIKERENPFRLTTSVLTSGPCSSSRSGSGSGSGSGSESKSQVQLQIYFGLQITSSKLYPRVLKYAATNLFNNIDNSSSLQVFQTYFDNIGKHNELSILGRGLQKFFFIQLNKICVYHSWKPHTFNFALQIRGAYALLKQPKRFERVTSVSKTSKFAKFFF